MKWNNIKDEGYKSKLDSLRELKPYEILGISIDSEVKEIKNAYKEKMKIYHPDKNGSFTKEYGEEISKILNDSYQIMLSRRKNARQ